MADDLAGFDFEIKNINKHAVSLNTDLTALSKNKNDFNVSTAVQGNKLAVELDNTRRLERLLIEEREAVNPITTGNSFSKRKPWPN